MVNLPEKEPDLDGVTGEVKQEEQDETPKGGFGVLMRTLNFATVIDRTIQIVCVFAALCSGAGEWILDSPAYVRSIHS